MHLHVHVMSTCTLAQSDWFYQVLQSCHIQVSRLIPFNSNFLVLLSTKKKFYFQPLLHEVHLSPLSTLQLASVSQNLFRFCNPTLETWAFFQGLENLEFTHLRPPREQFHLRWLSFSSHDYLLVRHFFDALPSAAIRLISRALKANNLQVHLEKKKRNNMLWWGITNVTAIESESTWLKYCPPFIPCEMNALLFVCHFLAIHCLLRKKK